MGSWRRLLALGVIALSVAFAPEMGAQTKRPFTVAEEIGMTLFGDAKGGKPEVHFSPDGSYFAVWTERGRLDVDRPEDSLRFYRSQDVVNLLKLPEDSLLRPTWIVTRSTNKSGRIIDSWRWLADSSGVAYLERTEDGKKRLMLADLQKRAIQGLTDATEDVGAFDVRDRQHFVFTVNDPVEAKEWQVERQAPAVVGTGRWFLGLLLSDNPMTDEFLKHIPNLWAVDGGKAFSVEQNGAPISFTGELALSPDGKSILTTQPVSDIPASWEALYAPPYPSYPYRIHAGHKEPQNSSVHTFVRIDLRTGKTQALTDGPVSTDAGWFAFGSASWSSDGKEVLLPGVFPKNRENKPSRPCIAVFDLPSRTLTCVEMLKGRTENEVEEGYHEVLGAHFADRDKQRVEVLFIDHSDHSFKTRAYERASDGTWQVKDEFEGTREMGPNALEVSVRQSFSEPPLLVAKDKQTSRVIWDPNPQLKDIQLGETTIYTWKDKDGRTWKGGLYKPDNYEKGLRYPLVIQTHGFTESEFRPSGLFPTANAARALTTAGIMVLQVGGPDAHERECGDQTPDEAPCLAAGYAAAATQLVTDGLVNPERVGIIGFSRSCFHVMEALSTNLYDFKAASVTDGVMATYLQSIVTVDFNNNMIPDFGNAVMGGPPFGGGLQQWFKRSPGFNLDKIHAPLLIVGEGPFRLLGMWEPYAGLRLLHKPADIIMLNTDEHVLTNPTVRMASQGGSVDWFRFWLKGEEGKAPDWDPDRYVRWRKLREMQEANETKAAEAKVPAAPTVK